MAKAILVIEDQIDGTLKVNLTFEPRLDKNTEPTDAQIAIVNAYQAAIGGGDVLEKVVDGKAQP